MARLKPDLIRNTFCKISGIYHISALIAHFCVLKNSKDFDSRFDDKVAPKIALKLCGIGIHFLIEFTSVRTNYNVVIFTLEHYIFFFAFGRPNDCFITLY